MNDSRAKSIEVRIHEEYDQLPESERKLADVILDSPGDLSSYTATELTSLAGVSKAAGTRLFRRLGFANFEEAKLLARDRTHWGSPLYLERKSRKNVIPLSDYLKEEVSVLENSLMRLNPEDIDAVCEKILAARRIYLLGYRNSNMLANYLRWQLLQFRGDVQLMPTGGETVGEYIGDFLPDDLLIVFALRRRPVRLEAIMKASKEKQIPILLFIDPTARGQPGLADWTFTTHVETSTTFDSLSAALSVARYIAISSLNRAGTRGRAHLERIERQHEALGEFE
ncbi:MurR/RpiR family transcriptional regulator [Cohaesibacter marisflavi]|uniref:MurR/RpiR family transcriptional regulator n=1 Tax=Cohaesibacter marisflavi TaxID=655353 RepID=UPI0029C79985|nr:MurR/RpiR family transcriptional regulator [Cohaesibacter marisflavi]